MADWKWKNVKSMDYNTLLSYKKHLEDTGHKGGKEYNRVLSYIPQSSGYKTAMFQQEQDSKIGDYMNRYNETIQNQPKMQDVWNRISQEQGLDDARKHYLGLRGQALDLQEQYEKAPEQVANESRGFDVNAQQLVRIQQARQGEIARNLTPTARLAEQAGTQYSTMHELARNELSAEQYQMEKELQPFATEAQLLDSALARQVTMYTADMQNQTNILLAKLARDGSLKEAELKRLNDLVMLEKDYELKKKQFDYERQFKTVSGGISRPALPLP